MKHENSLAWIESAGGLLLLLEENLLPFWRRCFSDSGDALTDYDRACDVNDYISAKDVDSGRAIVLGDEPLSTTWWTSTNKKQSFLVRWDCAENETAVIESLKYLPEISWQKTDVEFQVKEGKLILFDSACSGSNIDDCLRIEISKARYAIEMLHYKPDNQTSLILYRFGNATGA
jgi:hypothetical protein